MESYIILFISVGAIILLGGVGLLLLQEYFMKRGK